MKNAATSCTVISPRCSSRSSLSHLRSLQQLLQCAAPEHYHNQQGVFLSHGIKGNIFVLVSLPWVTWWSSCSGLLTGECTWSSCVIKTSICPCPSYRDIMIRSFCIITIVLECRCVYRNKSYREVWLSSCMNNRNYVFSNTYIIAEVYDEQRGRAITPCLVLCILLYKLRTFSVAVPILKDEAPLL